MNNQPQGGDEDQREAILAQAIQEVGTPMTQAQNHLGAVMWTVVPVLVLWFTGWASPWWALLVYPVALFANASEENARAQRVMVRVEELTKEAVDGE